VQSLIAHFLHYFAPLSAETPKNSSRKSVQLKLYFNPIESRQNVKLKTSAEARVGSRV
jgi:hypothetical protein